MKLDMADVNGRMFLNNVSLGIYGDAGGGSLTGAGHGVITLWDVKVAVLVPLHDGRPSGSRTR